MSNTKNDWDSVPVNGGCDKAEKFAMSARKYLLINLMLIDELYYDSKFLVSENEEDEDKKLLVNDICDKIKEIRSNQAEAIAASFGKSHTIP